MSTNKLIRDGKVAVLYRDYIGVELDYFSVISRTDYTLATIVANREKKSTTGEFYNINEYLNQIKQFIQSFGFTLPMVEINIWKVEELDKDINSLHVCWVPEGDLYGIKLGDFQSGCLRDGKIHEVYHGWYGYKSEHVICYKSYEWKTA